MIMDKINPVVAAKVASELARAREGVAKLESRQRTAAINTGGSWRGVNLGKLLTEARWQAESWARLQDAMASLGGAVLEAAQNVSDLVELIGSPMAYRVYSETAQREIIVCTREECADPGRWNNRVRYPVGPGEVGGTWSCWVCGSEIVG